MNPETKKEVALVVFSAGAATLSYFLGTLGRKPSTKKSMVKVAAILGVGYYVFMRANKQQDNVAKMFGINGE